GVVYYANYLRYFESARSAYWRALGRTYKDLEAWSVAVSVIEAHCTYKKPAHYEDLLEGGVEGAELRSASLRFSYVVRRGLDVLAEGWTRHAVTGSDGRPRAMPDAMRNMIKSR